ncbi:unnamed protein product [Camellia sinensis]
MVLPIVVLFIVLLSMSFQILESQAQLRVGFYRDKCIAAEFIVKEEVEKAFARDKGMAPGLIRMHFHDCLVRGCDCSIGIDSTPNNLAEKDGPPNGITLRGFEVIENAKTRLEAQCKGVVSCADILAFAARDSAHITGGLSWDVPAGRRDGRISHAAETIDIPAPFDNLDQATQAFAKKGLTQEEMVALAGAHTIGRSHCSSFSNRLYNFSSTRSQDPSVDPSYAVQLKQQCPREHGEELQFNTKNGGQRIATLLMYLSNVEEGGETIFPVAKGNFSVVPWWNELSECGKKGLSVKPRMGDALLFSSGIIKKPLASRLGGVRRTIVMKLLYYDDVMFSCGLRASILQKLLRTRSS